MIRIGPQINNQSVIARIELVPPTERTGVSIERPIEMVGANTRIYTERDDLVSVE